MAGRLRFGCRRRRFRRQREQGARQQSRRLFGVRHACLAGSLASNDPFAAGFSSPSLLNGSSSDDSNVASMSAGVSSAGTDLAAVRELSTLVLSAIALTCLFSGRIWRRMKHAVTQTFDRGEMPRQCGPCAMISRNCYRGNRCQFSSVSSQFNRNMKSEDRSIHPNPIKRPILRTDGGLTCARRSNRPQWVGPISITSDDQAVATARQIAESLIAKVLGGKSQLAGMRGHGRLDDVRQSRETEQCDAMTSRATRRAVLTVSLLPVTCRVT
jgi:hypothetical protein